MFDKRKLKRRHLIYYLRVFRQPGGEQLGHLVDITEEGIMLISEQEFPAGLDYDLRMSLPAEISGKVEIDFKVHTLWCKRDVNPDFFAGGFKILEISDSDREIIERLVVKFGFRD